MSLLAASSLLYRRNPSRCGPSYIVKKLPSLSFPTEFIYTKQTLVQEHMWIDITNASLVADAVMLLNKSQPKKKKPEVLMWHRG